MTEQTVLKKKGLLVKARRKCATVSRACQVAKVGRGTYYRWLEDDPIFADQINEAETEAIEEVEEELRRRALISEPKDRDTTALIFYLKGNRPEKYRENIHVTDDRLTPQVKELLRVLATAADG